MTPLNISKQIICIILFREWKLWVLHEHTKGVTWREAFGGDYGYGGCGVLWNKFAEGIFLGGFHCNLKHY